MLTTGSLRCAAAGLQGRGGLPNCRIALLTVSLNRRVPLLSEGCRAAGHPAVEPCFEPVSDVMLFIREAGQNQ